MDQGAETRDFLKSKAAFKETTDLGQIMQKTPIV